MGSKSQYQRFFLNSNPSTRQFGSGSTNNFIDEKLYNAFVDEQAEFENHFAGFKIKTSKCVDFFIDSDEEFKSELDNALKQYKKNAKKTERKTEPNLGKEKSKYAEELNQTAGNTNDFNSEKSKENVNSNEEAIRDVRELINYFFLPKNEKSTGKSYTDFKNQGAFPKYKIPKEKTIKFETANRQVDVKPNRGRKKQENFPSEIRQHSNNYTFIKNINSDDVIVKISEKICSEPFFYVVPENPSPNFFLSPGSYYVIPKAYNFESEEKIFFHPEKEAAESDLNGNGYSEIKSTTNGEQYKQIQTNNLGKDAPEKIDSHLNIGPGDVKFNDWVDNLEYNCNSEKVFNKNITDSDTSSVSSEEASLEKPEAEVSNSTKEAEKVALVVRSLELNKVMEKVLLEFPDLDVESANEVAEKYLFDEEGLKNYITAARLEQKLNLQLDRMMSALPETSLEELRNKCDEFEGRDDLVDHYIQETQRVNKLNQQILEMQLVIPDADPEFLRSEIERLNGDVGAINILTDKLLDEGNYPKLIEDPLSEERKKWWRVYVELFTVENFLSRVPNPRDFADVADKTDPELVEKFLQSRYPTRSPYYLMGKYDMQGKNLVKTCEVLKEVTTIRLSESSFRNEAFSEDFLKEICYIDHKKEIDGYLKEMEEKKEIEKEEARVNNSFLFCPLCSDEELIASEAVCCLEGHLFCKNCIRRYIVIKMGEGVFKFVCPSESCDTFFSYATLEAILPQNMLTKISKGQQAEEISRAKVDGLESCPYCEFAYIPNPEDSIFKCQNSACLIETCRKCHERNHIPFRCEEIERPADLEARKKIEESMTQELVRVCPNCGKKFVKIDGCNKMVCVCGTVICYICRKAVSGYEHFRNVPGGCPLHTNNETVHKDAVVRAGIQTRAEILQENQNIRLLHDPTVYKY